jgi:hypothetical protein
MGVATGLMLGGLAAQGVMGAVKAKKQSNAAKKASEDQVKGTQEASNYVREGMGQIGQLYAPYVNRGASISNMLGRLTTPGPGARFASPGPPNAMPQGGFNGGGMPPNQAAPRGGPPPPGYGQPPPGYGMPPGYGGTFAQMGPQMQRGPMGPPPGMPMRQGAPPYMY